MGMTSLAIRISAVRALQHAQTIAGERVFDSAILPIDKLLSDDPLSFVVVSTESESMTPAGRDLMTGNGEVDLVIDVGIARASRLPAVDGDGEAIELELAQSDGSLEVAAAILSRQIMAALFLRGGGVWGDVFRRFVTSVSAVNSVRAASRDGVKVIGRQTIYSVQAIAEPAFAEVADGTPWHDFMAALDGDPAMAQIANVVRTAIEGRPLDWPTTYNAAALAAFMTEAEGEAMGLTSIAPAVAEGDTETLLTVQVSPDGWQLTGEAAEENFPDPPA